MKNNVSFDEYLNEGLNHMKKIHLRIDAEYSY